MSDHPILDPQAIETLRMLNPGDNDAFLKELIEIYLQDAPAHITEIEKALAATDATAVMRAAHSLKGSSSNFGATYFASLAQQIEHQGKAGTLGQTAAALVTLKTEYTRVAGALTALMQGT